MIKKYEHFRIFMTVPLEGLNHEQFLKLMHEAKREIAGLKRKEIKRIAREEIKKPMKAINPYLQSLNAKNENEM